MAETELEGMADGDLYARQAWNPIPATTTTRTKAATTAIRMRRSRLRAAACSAARRARSRAFMFFGLFIAATYPARTGFRASKPATQPTAKAQHREPTRCRTRFPLEAPDRRLRNIHSRC